MVELKIFLSLFGLLVGSFLNVLIYRLPKELNIAIPRSSCPKCNKLIYWYENIPVVSYLFLKGKCSKCKTKISCFYPIIELITGIAAFLIAPSYLSLNTSINFLFYFSVFCVFLVHIIIDFKHKILPDSLNIYLFFLFVSFALYRQVDLSFWIVGGVIGFGVPFVITWAFYKFRGQIGLGGGDIKLFGALGVHLGYQGIFLNLFLSCTLGTIFALILIALKKMNKENPIAFGPFILIVAFGQIFFPDSFDRLLHFIFESSS